MITTVIAFIVVLGILILVHELGHFLFAKMFGVGVEEFGFGYPPRIFGKKMGKTLYSLNWIPFGGFVKIKGIVGDDQNVQGYKDADSYVSRKAWQKFCIIFGGILFNVVFCLLVLTVIFRIGVLSDLDHVPAKGNILSEDRGLFIEYVVPGGPAEESGIQIGDRLFALDNKEIISLEDVREYSNKKGAGAIIQAKTSSGDKIVTLSLLEGNASLQVGLGVALIRTGKVSLPLDQAFLFSLDRSRFVTVEIFKVIGNLFRGNVPEEIGGPVAVFQATGTVAKEGFLPLFVFAAYLSLNLGIINLLPIPPLDGGKILFLTFETVFRRPLNQKVEEWIHRIGFAVMILLMLLVTFRDISRF